MAFREPVISRFLDGRQQYTSSRRQSDHGTAEYAKCCTQTPPVNVIEAGGERCEKSRLAWGLGAGFRLSVPD